ncbi:hypothetical protein CDAIGKPJ_02586 [Aeromonas salmonicida]|nr:hypothetical protein ASA01S_063_00060 [Aeromonas salmonicida subsp. masoucida NBRC 13784]
MNRLILTLLLTLGSPLALATAICDDTMPRTSPTPASSIAATAQSRTEARA